MKDSRFRYEVSIDECFGIFHWDDGDSTLDAGYNTRKEKINKSGTQDHKHMTLLQRCHVVFTNAGHQSELLSAGYHGWSCSSACPQLFGPLWSCREASQRAEGPRSGWPGSGDDCPLLTSPLLSGNQKATKPVYLTLIQYVYRLNLDKTDIKRMKVWTNHRSTCSKTENNCLQLFALFLFADFSVLEFLSPRSEREEHE